MDVAKLARFDSVVQKRLDIERAHELVAAIPLDLPLEQYRLRLAPLAEAILSGAPDREIKRRRATLLPDVWDATLERALRDGIRRLQALLSLAEAEAPLPATQRRMAHALVDRVMFELLENHDRNIAALAGLEAELERVPREERLTVALVAVRGACGTTRIPRNEIRAAIVRSSRAAAERGFDHADAAEDGLRQLARLLATDDRRMRARAWVAQMAAIHREPFPLLAEELSRLAAATPVRDPGDDPIWLQACLGIALTESIEAASES